MKVESTAINFLCMVGVKYISSKKKNKNIIIYKWKEVWGGRGGGRGVYILVSSFNLRVDGGREGTSG